MEEPVTIVDRDVLKVLSVDTRMDIIKELSQGDRTPSDLGKRLKKSSSTIVEHLEMLTKAGLVKKVEQPGKKWIFYTLTEKGYGIISSRSRRLIIILTSSFFGLFLGGAGILYNLFYTSASLSRYINEPLASSGASEIAKDATTSIVQENLIVQMLFAYLPTALIAISLVGITYYFYKRSKKTRCR